MDLKSHKETENERNETSDTSIRVLQLFTTISTFYRQFLKLNIPTIINSIHNPNFCMSRRHNAPFLSSRKTEQTPDSTSTTFSSVPPVRHLYTHLFFPSASVKGDSTSTTFSSPHFRCLKRISSRSTWMKPGSIKMQQYSTTLLLSHSFSTLQDSALCTNGSKRYDFSTFPSCSQSNIPTVACSAECSQEERYKQSFSFMDRRQTRKSRSTCHN